MPTLTEAVAAIERHIGFPYSRMKQVARRLQDAEILPLGAPGASPEVTIDHVIDLIIALAAGTTLRQSAASVAAYSSLTPAGADVSCASPSVPRNARVILDRLAALAADGNSLSGLNIEFVSTWAEISLHWADGPSQRFRETGALASYWQDGKQRRATAIPGTAFAELFKDLFGVRIGVKK